MKKEKIFAETRFSADTLKEALSAIRELAKSLDDDLDQTLMKVEHDDSTWAYDAPEEFLADYRKYSSYAHLWISGRHIELDFNVHYRETTISVKAKERADIESVFEVFEKHAASARLDPLPPPPKQMPVIFIGHGRDSQWRDIKDHLHDKHGYKIEAYETGARAGHTIRDILEDMAGKSSFAILVLTGEDEQADGKLHARQNVIHESGLFQGRLGFARAILLLEEGVEEFSNICGVQHIKFSKGNIKETYGDVLATLAREFGKQG